MNGARILKKWRNGVSLYLLQKFTQRGRFCPKQKVSSILLLKADAILWHVEHKICKTAYAARHSTFIVT